MLIQSYQKVEKSQYVYGEFNFVVFGDVLIIVGLGVSVMEGFGCG